MNKPFKLILPIFTIVCLLVSLKPFDVQAQSPWFSIDPSSGPAGIGVSITGGGDFTPDQKGQIQWYDGSFLGDAVIDGKGVPSGSFYIPGNADPGTYDILLSTDLEKAYSSYTVIGTKPTDTPYVAPPQIKEFAVNPSSIVKGDCANLSWSVNNAQSVQISGDFGTQYVDASGILQVCPQQTTNYEIVAEGYSGSDPSSTSAIATLTVTSVSISTSTFTPSRTPTKFPGYINTPTFTPSRTFTPTTQIPTLPPQTIDHRCYDLGLGANAVVANFDDLAAGATLYYQYQGKGVVFPADRAVIDNPPMGARSPARAVRNLTADFYGPLAIQFNAPVSAAGLFVGRQSATSSRAVYAVLIGYSFNRDGTLAPIARNRVRLPAAATPFEYCLVVRAPEGQSINSLSLDYVDTFGVSASEYRWFDDLAWVPSGIPMQDNPPVVTIITPPNGSRQTTNGVSLMARVREDVLLSFADFYINGGTANYAHCQRHSAADPTLYDCYGSLPGLNPDADNTVRVVAHDTAGHQGEASTTFGFYPPFEGDLWITGIEVNQSVQTATNSIPLLGNKVTVVRVFAQSREDRLGAWKDVSAVLTVHTGSQSFNYTPANISAAWVRSTTGTAVPVIYIPSSGSERTDLESGFYFILDRRDTAPGDRNLEVTLFTASNRPEADTENNRQSLRVHFYDALNLTFWGQTYGYYRSVTYDRNQQVSYWITEPHPWSSFEGHRVVAENILPISNLTILPVPGINQGTYTLPLTGNPPPPAFLTLENARQWAHRIAPGLSSTAIVYVLEPADNCTCGLAGNNGRDRNVIINGHDQRSASTIGHVMAHELMHGFGYWYHSWDDPNFPYFKDTMGTQIGIQTTNPSALELFYSNEGHLSFDIMSYSAPSWASPYSYCTAMANLGGPTCDATTRTAQNPIEAISYHLAAPSHSEEIPFLYISGWVNPDGTSGSISPFETILSRENIATSINPDGFFQVVLEDSASNTLATYSFELEPADGETVENYNFSVIVPQDPAIARITLRQDDLLLAERLTGGFPPYVILTSPNGGEDWSDMQAITWIGKGEAPLFSVDYSPDGGTSWLPLGVRLTESSLVVDFNSLPGSDNALIRVTASEGTAYSSDQSDANFHVPEKPPVVGIETPAEGESFTEGLPVLIRLSGYDWEDGALQDGSISWSSDQDGTLGTGPWLSIASLSVGQHTLTATATDSQGNQSSASVHITVAAHPIEEISLAPASSRTNFRIFMIVIITLGGIVLVAGVAALLIILRRWR